MLQTRNNIRLFLLALAAMLCGLHSMAQTDNSVKGERLAIREGNQAYNKGNFQKALECYEDALILNAASEAALFNKAVTLSRLASSYEDSQMTDSIMGLAAKIYGDLGASAANASIKEKANYNLGNMAFNKEDYKTSIEQYKKVLRSNPANLKARENLRVAQLKLPPEDKQDQQQDQQEKEQEQQQQQEQQNQQQNQQQQQQQRQNGNADQILQSMQNRENRTRRDMEKREVPVGVPVTDKPW